MSDEKTDPSDADIRWGDPNPVPAQREIEGYVRTLFARCAHVPIEAIRQGAFVEGIELERPCRTEAELRVVADALFVTCRDWARHFDARNVPHSLFVLGCGPDDSAAFRIVAFDLPALMRAAPALGRELGASHVLVVHSTIQPLGPDGTDALTAASRLIVRGIMAAGGDHESLPWGYVQRVVARAFDGRTGQERAWAWMQSVHGDEARQELSPRAFAPYVSIQVGADGATVLREGADPMAEA